ncbi:hypothetical protein [Marinifilum sp.]|uniref:hypothetical protein n=1 Tax=Marinifilum sp. TaxID=2033137 RepID=UPI003BAB669D
MKNKIIMAALGLFIGLCSCSDDDSPFEGTDNYISFFQLVKDGTQYDALITGDSITIEINANVDLSNAKAEYQISELSEITPDPKTISDWDKTLDFKVKSYNNEEKTYYFSLIKNQISSNGDVSLLTQADVDAFASKGVTIIDGNLIIDDVENLDALNNITEVSKNIVIKDSFGLDQFNALKKLKKAGNIYFGNQDKAFNPKQKVEIQFESLASVGKVYVNTAKVSSVDFPKLENAYAVTINSDSIESIVLSSLNNIYGNFSIQSEKNEAVAGSNNVLKKLELSKLTSVLGSVSFTHLKTNEEIDLSKLTSIGGNLKLSSLTQLNNLKLDELKNVNQVNLKGLDSLLSLNLPKLTHANSIVFNVGSNGILEELYLPELTTVNNNLDLIGLIALLKVELPKLTSTGSLKISGTWDTAFVKEIKCPELTNIGTELYISNVAAEEIAFPKLSACPMIEYSKIAETKSLDFSKISDLESIELGGAYALENLNLPKSLNTLILNGYKSATAFPTLQGIETISGELKVSQYNLPKITIESVKDLNAYSQTSGSDQTELEFTDLESIGELKIGLVDLISIKAPKLKKMDRFNLMVPWALKTLEWPLLTEISSELKIKGANWTGAASRCPITDLNAFTTVTKIGRVEIINCANLNDFSGLQNAVASLSEENWKVKSCKYNPTFQNMKDGEFIGE